MLNNSVTVNRFGAAAIHLLICALVALMLCMFFSFVWYPQPLFRAVGGWQMFSLILVVDVVLGPVLTLVLYRRGKKNLHWDLALVAVIQIAALLYGCYTMMIGRPVFIAALGGRFDVVQLSEINAREVGVSWGKPVWVGSKKLQDTKAHERLLFSGFSYAGYPETHLPLSQMADQLIKEAKPLSNLKRLNPGNEQAIDTWLDAHGVSEASAVYQPLRANAEDMAVIISATSGAVVGIAPFKPWD